MPSVRGLAITVARVQDLPLLNVAVVLDVDDGVRVRNEHSSFLRSSPNHMLRPPSGPSASRLQLRSPRNCPDASPPASRLAAARGRARPLTTASLCAFLQLAKLGARYVSERGPRRDSGSALGQSPDAPRPRWTSRAFCGNASCVFACKLSGCSGQRWISEKRTSVMRSQVVRSSVWLASCLAKGLFSVPTTNADRPIHLATLSNLALWALHPRSTGVKSDDARAPSSTPRLHKRWTGRRHDPCAGEEDVVVVCVDTTGWNRCSRLLLFCSLFPVCDIRRRARIRTPQHF